MQDYCGAHHPTVASQCRPLGALANGPFRILTAMVGWAETGLPAAPTHQQPSLSVVDANRPQQSPTNRQQPIDSLAIRILGVVQCVASFLGLAEKVSPNLVGGLERRKSAGHSGWRSRSASGPDPVVSEAVMAMEILVSAPPAAVENRTTRDHAGRAADMHARQPR